MEKRGPTEADFDRYFGVTRVDTNSIYARTVRGLYVLEDDKDIAVFALAHGARPKEAARDAGVALATVHAWMQDSAFKERVAELRKELLEPLRDEIQSTLSDAFHVIRDNLQSADPKLAQDAAKFILDRFGGSLMDSNHTGPQVAIQFNVEYGDLRAEAERRLAAYNNSTPITAHAEVSEDETSI